MNAASHSAEHMRLAVELSRRGYPAPNPRVGCVIARDDDVVGVGWHDHAGGPHAEVVALNQAGESARGATMYVTLEPCAHHGRTPPCVDAIANAGIKELCSATIDPNELAAGGCDELRRRGIPCEIGLLEEEAAQVNEAFLFAHRERRPFVRLKAAITQDGYMARPSRASEWITGQESRRRGRLLRAEMGAVLVGAGTVIADDPQLTVRDLAVVNEPLRIILDVQNQTTGKERVFAEAGRTLRYTAVATRECDIQMPTANGEFDLTQILDDLFAKGVTGLLVEGGPQTLHGFMKAGLYERLDLFIGPKAFGEGIGWNCGIGLDRLRLVRTEQLGQDAHLSYIREP